MTPELERMFRDIPRPCSGQAPGAAELPSPDELMERHLYSAMVRPAPCLAAEILLKAYCAQRPHLHIEIGTRRPPFVMARYSL